MWRFIGSETVGRHSNHSADRVQGNKCPSSLKNKFYVAVVLVTGVWKVPGSHFSWGTEKIQVLFIFPQLYLTNAEKASSLVHKRWLLIIPKSIFMDLTAIRNTEISSWLLPVDFLLYWLAATGFDFENIISKYFSNFHSVFTTFFVSIIPSHTFISSLHLQSFISYPAKVFEETHFYHLH